MTRKVYISSDMAHNESLAITADENPLYAILWPWFLTACDDWGRAKASARELRSLVFAGNELTSLEVIEGALHSYAEQGMILLYESGGRRYFQVPQDSWFKYQTHIRAEKREHDNSRLPAPEREGARSSAGTRAIARETIPSPSPSPSPSLTEEVGSKGESEGEMDHPLTGPLPGPTSGWVTEADEILDLLVKLGAVRSTQNLAAVRLVVQKLPSVAALEVALDHYRWQEPMDKKDRLKDQIHGWQKAMQRAYEGSKYQRTPTPPSSRSLKERPPPTGEEREILRRRAAAQEARASAST